MIAAWWARIFIQLAPKTQLSRSNSQHINRIASQRQSSNNQVDQIMIITGESINKEQTCAVPACVFDGL